MSAFKQLGIPAPGPQLKLIMPYLQRADEVFDQEPIVAYWCTYYAAQLGISVKAKDAHSRNTLLALLDLLERMKQNIGEVEAMEVEDTSAAYVENFALKVFGIADNEDRNGKSTRATAKKFLAASHFLEVLKVFPQSEISESNADKIRYAKWKAADIAKAFREGRKPTPGPAAEATEDEFPAVAAPPPVPDTPPTNVRPPTPPQLNPAEVARVNQQFSPFAAPPHPPQAYDASPEAWSTAATPGNFTPRAEDVGDPINLNIPSQPVEPSLVTPVPSNVLPPGFVPSAPPVAGDVTPPAVSQRFLSSVVVPPQFELTPLIIAKAQKHSRFAISALDYDDAETAKKELRAALALLGD